jgi:antitoxin YefM
MFGTITEGSRITMSITASEARKNLFQLLAKVNDDATSVEIISRGGDAVLVSKAEFDALTETAYLLRSPKNARRLLESIDQWKSGQTMEMALIDPDVADGLAGAG